MKTHRVMRRYSKPQPAFFTLGTLRKIDTNWTGPPSTHFSAQNFFATVALRHQGRSMSRGAMNISQQTSTLIVWGECDAPVRRLFRTEDEQDEQNEKNRT
jgi:hypothetical protein